MTRIITKSRTGNQSPPLSEQIMVGRETIANCILKIKNFEKCTDREAFEIICKIIQWNGPGVLAHKLVKRRIFEWQDRVFNEAEPEEKRKEAKGYLMKICPPLAKEPRGIKPYLSEKELLNLKMEYQKLLKKHQKEKKEKRASKDKLSDAPKELAIKDLSKKYHISTHTIEKILKEKIFIPV